MGWNRRSLGATFCSWRYVQVLPLGDACVRPGSNVPNSNSLFFSNLRNGVGVSYLVFAKSLREHVPNVFVFMFMNMFGGSMFVLMYLYITGVHFTFDGDVHTGLWGFLNVGRVDRLPLELYMVCICNLMGTMG